MTATAAAPRGHLALAALAGLLCAALTACGTVRAGEAAGPAPVTTPAPYVCDLDRTTGGGSGTVAPDLPTEDQTGGYAGPPTDQETGPHAGPPTDGETGAHAGPPTDGDTGPPDPPTDQDTGTPGPPTDGSAASGGATGGAVTNGAGPCGAAGWFDMTADFFAYYAAHRTASDPDVQANGTADARVRKVRGTGLAEVSFTSREVGKGRAEDARGVIRVFAAWRHEVYGDTGTLTVRAGGSPPVTVLTGSW
ncbi:hypothetical protein ABZY44_20495 [Streptomyces sp. NPDC006544]|uniref:hypothetical protein n=1 Tax=Streptomyces sp. NPDC006544 TaxID=3154583 RepID=UPI0033B2E3B1